MSSAISLDLFAEIVDATANSPVIVHAPHGGISVPGKVRGQFKISDQELLAEHLALVDHATDELARQAVSQAAASAVINKLSRLVVDVERFDSPEEEKNSVGMGVLYTHGHRRQLIRELPTDVTELMSFYRQYAQAMEGLTERALATHGRAIIIDVHSYWTDPQPHEVHRDEPRPELCVGFDDLHFSPALRAAVAGSFSWLQQGENQTFHGSYVPLKYFMKDSRVQSVMLEIRRDQYMNEATGTGDPSVVNRLAASLRHLISKVTATHS